MRKIAIVLLVGCLSTLLASDVRLAWDASVTPGVTNYVLYSSLLSATNLPPNPPVRLSVGTNLTARVENLVPGQWWFAVTAQKDGVESDQSNRVQAEVPKAPANMRVIALQFSGTLSNFYDVGFFKLRLP